MLMIEWEGSKSSHTVSLPPLPLPPPFSSHILWRCPPYPPEAFTVLRHWTIQQDVELWLYKLKVYMIVPQWLNILFNHWWAVKRKKNTVSRRLCECVRGDIFELSAAPWKGLTSDVPAVTIFYPDLNTSKRWLAFFRPHFSVWSG